jgi:hypothetical protein
MKAIAFCICLLTALTGTAISAVFYVHPDSTQDNIQACLDMCSTDDTVLVAPGIYYEHIVWPSTNGIKLLSEYGRDTTFIDGGDSGRVILMGANADSLTVVRGFTIQNGYADSLGGAGIRCWNGCRALIEDNRILDNRCDVTSRFISSGGGIGCEMASPTIRNNHLEGNHTLLSGGGIGLWNSHPEIVGNTIVRNTSDTAGAGIFCQTASSPVIRGNIIEYDSAGYGAGIFVRNSSNPVIDSNVLKHNKADWGGGLYTWEGCRPTVTWCTIDSNQASGGAPGAFIRQGSVYTISHCTFRGNDGPWTIYCQGPYCSPTFEFCTITGSSCDGVAVESNASCTIRWSSLYGNAYNAVISQGDCHATFNWWGHETGPYDYDFNPGGQGDTISGNVDFQPWLGSDVIHYVHPDSAFNTIQAGLDACDENEAVCVGPGTYYEHLVWPDTAGVRLASHQLRPDSTIIDGGDSGRVIQMGASADSSTAVYGFTIQNGYLDEGHGAGILCERGATPLIERNYFFGNVNEDPLRDGGGIGCFYAHPLVRNNVFERNRAKWGGGLGLNNGCPEVSDNAFTANVADSMGGGISAYYSNTPRPLFQRNRFEYDSAYVGGAIYCCVSNPRIVENWIGHNHAEACGGMFFTGISPAELIGDTIVGNIADVAGGGIGCSYSDLIIRHCVISDNHAPDGGGIVCWDAGEPDIDSCVISGNSVCGVKSYCRVRHPTINYCDIFDNVGYGVFNADTEYIDAEDNWWGDSTGPHHPLLNPGGQGDTVSDYVDFDPWIGSGISEQTLKHELFLREPATVLRGVLRWSHREAGVLLDISGRQVMNLEPGLNDIRHVAPGVYFVRRPETDDGRPGTAVRKIVIQR